MIRYPHIQAQAQAELDSVTRGERLPDYDDMDDGTKLPFVRAVGMELLRWGVLAPLGMPHLLQEDDLFEGYYLPKGPSV